MTMLTRGADRLLELHAAELPQKDELCGCFWATLALRLNDEGPVEQDDVALVAGSVITSHGSAHLLPRGQARRNDYRARAAGDRGRRVVRHVGARRRARRLASSRSGRLAAHPVRGLDAPGVRALLRAAAEAERARVLIANVQTGAFWGSHPTAAQLARYLESGDLGAGPAPTGTVGHFVGLVGLSEGRAGAFVTVADTYPVLGLGGVHLQPVEAVASALARTRGARRRAAGRGAPRGAGRRRHSRAVGQRKPAACRGGVARGG